MRVSLRLDADEAEYVSEATGASAALFHIRFGDGSPLAGDCEDLEEYEILEARAMPTPDP